jgi:hypothetical protein
LGIVESEELRVEGQDRRRLRFRLRLRKGVRSSMFDVERHRRVESGGTGPKKVEV